MDKHIRRLDADLARFEAEIHMKENEKKKESVSSMFQQRLITLMICNCPGMITVSTDFANVYNVRAYTCILFKVSITFVCTLKYLRNRPYTYFVLTYA